MWIPNHIKVFSYVFFFTAQFSVENVHKRKGTIQAPIRYDLLNESYVRNGEAKKQKKKNMGKKRTEKYQLLTLWFPVYKVSHMMRRFSYSNW